MQAFQTQKPEGTQLRLSFVPFNRHDLQLRSLTLFSFPSSCSPWSHLSTTSCQSAQHVSRVVQISQVMNYLLWVFSSNWLIEILRSPKLNPLSSQCAGSQGLALSDVTCPGLAQLPLLVCSLPNGCPALLLPSHQHGFTYSPVLMPPLTKPTVCNTEFIIKARHTESYMEGQ